MSRRATWARRGLRAGYALELVGDLSAPDALAVLAVAIRGRLSPAALAELAGCKPATAQARLRELAAAGWIVRSCLEAEIYEPIPVMARAAAESVAATS